MRQTTLTGRLVDSLKKGPKSLSELYDEFGDANQDSIRGRINENLGKKFIRLKRAVYVASLEDTISVIVEGDAWEEIKNIRSCSIETVITDHGYECLNETVAQGTSRKKDNKWSYETRDLDKEILRDMYRVLKDQGHYFCFAPSDSAVTLSHNQKLISDAKEVGFIFVKRWMWDKVHFGLGYNGRSQYEQILFFSKGKRRMPVERNVADVLSHPKIYEKKKFHEAQKPVELYKDIIRYSCNKGDYVLDPFAGSLVTSRAGMERGVNTICIEKDERMIELAIRKRHLDVIKIKGVE